MDTVRHILTLTRDYDGAVVSTRVIKVTGDDTAPEEYRAAIMAREMYRDACHAKGVWPRRDPPGTPSFWTGN
jgi:hypothetical protein